MKILVLNNATPFIRGGAEELADNLASQLNARPGIQAEVLRIPFRATPRETLLEQIWSHRNLRLYKVDQVIALKFPAYLIPHAHKTIWLLHQFRQVYDLFEAGQSHIGCDDPGAEIVRLVREADNQCLRGCRKIFTNSPVTQNRLKRFNNFDAPVVYPPLNDPERFRGGEYSRYVFAGGRVGPGKRQHLLVEAMRFVRSDLRLVIAGPLDTDEYGILLRQIVYHYNLEDKVELRFGFRGRDEIAELVNSALVCSYLPVDEDSLGFVTMEAFTAAKPVITAFDAGGLLEIVEDKHTGLVVAPEPDQIADALDWFGTEHSRAAILGHAARSCLYAKQITWDHALETLLSG